jgi:hypothetical protein
MTYPINGPVPDNILAAGVASLDTAQVALASLSWLLHRVPGGRLTAEDAYSLQTRIDDLRDLLTAAEKALPQPPRDEALNEARATQAAGFFADMAARDPAELDRDRTAAWHAGTGADGICNCGEPRGAVPGDQCLNCGYTLTARQIEAADEAERRSPQAAADWAAANPESEDQ